MRTAFFFLALCAFAAVADGALKVKSLCPAKANGRFTGQISAQLTDDLEELTRVKRQERRRPGGRRRPSDRERPSRQTSPPDPDPNPETTAVPAPTQPPQQTGECSTASSQYRTENGRCNNLDNPGWGAVLAPFRRLLSPAYQYNDDDSNGPLIRSLTTNQPLPNVRNISATVHDGLSRPDPQFPVMLMQWGQFLDHDVTGTPVSDSNSSCCSEALVQSNAGQHSDVSIGGPCFPILVQNTDRFFTSLSSRCLEFTRSLRIPPEDEQQLNLLTSFIDASNVYGTSKEEMDNLRGNNGELKEGDAGQLPQGDNSNCILSDNNDYCLLADQSASIIHNKIARGLRTRHPEWDSETIFQETRKIVGALMQHITYTKYLPNIVGTGAMNMYGLNEDPASYAYDPLENPTLANVFSTAAFRFGHSSIPRTLNINGRTVPIQRLFNDPNVVLNELRGVVEGLLQEHAEEVDRWYATGMTNHLFETSPGDGSDIVSLNLQRGRDHGIQPNTYYHNYNISTNPSQPPQHLGYPPPQPPLPYGPPQPYSDPAYPPPMQPQQQQPVNPFQQAVENS